MDRLFIPGFGAPAGLYRPALAAGWTALELPRFRSTQGVLRAYRAWLESELDRLARRGLARRPLDGRRARGARRCRSAGAGRAPHAHLARGPAAAEVDDREPRRLRPAGRVVPVRRGRRARRRRPRARGSACGAQAGPRSARARPDARDGARSRQRLPRRRRRLRDRHARHTVALPPAGAAARVRATAGSTLHGGHMWMLTAPEQLAAVLGV